MITQTIEPGNSPDIFSQQNLEHMDETVSEVFSVQLGMDVATFTPPLAVENKTDRCREQTAMIGFAGIFSGMCEIRLSVPASLAITCAMLPDTPIAEGSDWICDALGELCNILAGGWKNRIPELGASCSLTIPTVIAGDTYHVHRPAHVVVNRRNYIFGDNHQLVLTLVYDPIFC